jgi:hypothetical protein
LSFRRYNTWVATIVAIVLGTIGATNMVLSLSPVIFGAPATRGANWQRDHDGIVALPVSDEAEFKLQRLADLAPTLETAEFGSSRVMAIGSRLTSPRNYNMALSGNSVAMEIAQARHVIDIAPHLRTMYLSVDWALGDIFRTVPISHLPRALPPELTANGLFKAAGDSLALPRVRGLVEPLLRDLAANREPELFYALRGLDRPQLCPDGTVGINLGFPGNYTCPGFRPDGSVSFEFRGVLDEASAASTIQHALVIDGVGPGALTGTDGLPNPDYLAAIADIALKLSTRGGRAVALVPPLFPGLKRAITNTPDLAGKIATFDAKVAEWSRRHQIALIDAATSEDWGCTVTDFIDGFHATASCYAKIFGRGR